MVILRNKKRKFHYFKHPSDINNVDIGEIMIPKKFLLVKKLLNTLLVTKIVKKLNKLNICLF